MGAPGGGEPSPTPPSSTAGAFRSLLSHKGKKRSHPNIPKFIKKLDEIPEIALPEDQPIKIALALADRGLVGQFMGRWPTTQSTDEWVQRNWRPLLPNNVICYAVGRGFFIFEFTTKEDRDLVFRNGPYFMGNQGLFLNKWTPDFDPSIDVPKEVPVWVRLPNLPLHCWSFQSLQKIGNGLGRFIDKADNKGQYTCARICVEVDLEVGLPEATKLTVGDWHHFQKLDYEKLPFKCRICHEHGHFQRNCPKAPSGDKVEEEGWKEIKKGKVVSKPNKQKKSGPMGNPQTNSKTIPVSNDGPSSGEKVHTSENHEETEDQSKKVKETEEETAVPLTEADQGGIAGNDEHISLASDSGEESKEKDSNSDSSQITPIKSTRGRKSKKKQREEITYRDVLQGSQKTLKGMMNTRSGRKHNRAPKGVSPSHSKNIIIAGDLNVTLAAEEKKGGSPVRDPAREWVEDIMISWDLEDIKPSAGKYTWSNKRLGPNHIPARLDRFLVQTSFLTSGLMASSKILPNCSSDHKPISLELSKDGFLGPIPFRFSPLWTQQEGFHEVVSEVWNQHVQGSPFYVWEEKLRALKRRLKEWVKTLKTPATKRKESLDSLAALQSSMEDSAVTQSLLQKEVELQKALHKASRDEEEYWRQKSRNLWLQAGDKNTSFFHKHAEARKQFKNVSEIRSHDAVVKDFEGIKRAAFTFFKELYSAPTDPPIDTHAYPINLIPLCVQDSVNTMLTAPISMDELKKALDCMEPDKAPGPDGFTARFLQSCWSTINKDLLRMVRKSQSCSKIGGSTNSAFLALLPKEKGASDFSRFRPISLCNTSYKLITKIISTRLKNILSDIIPENQGGFIKGRKILDNIVLVQEAVHSSCQRKEKGMVIKLDLENAFDRVRHDFLFTVMKKMGFSITFINWVKACIASPWIAPLVNGRSTEFFNASRGLRQGCPLSPLLYVIQASVLSFQLDYCQQVQTLPGLKMVHNVKDINHAQFVDDTLLLGGASIISTRSFKKELDIYKEASGSKINYLKSTIYGWNCSVKDLADIARLLEMKVC
eukprot:PITA_08795